MDVNLRGSLDQTKDALAKALNRELGEELDAPIYAEKDQDARAALIATLKENHDHFLTMTDAALRTRAQELFGVAALVVAALATEALGGVFGAGGSAALHAAVAALLLALCVKSVLSVMGEVRAAKSVQVSSAKSLLMLYGAQQRNKIRDELIENSRSRFEMFARTVQLSIVPVLALPALWMLTTLF